MTTTYSPNYKGTQWKIAQVELDPETGTPARTVQEPNELAGPTVYWPDGTTSYVLHFKGATSVGPSPTRPTPHCGPLRPCAAERRSPRARSGRTSATCGGWRHA